MFNWKISQVQRTDKGHVIIHLIIITNISWAYAPPCNQEVRLIGACFDYYKVTPMICKQLSNKETECQGQAWKNFLL